VTREQAEKYRRLALECRAMARTAGHQKRQDLRPEGRSGSVVGEPAELHRVAEAPARAHGRLVPDKIYPGMWRVVGPSGTLSDIVNETRARDVAWYLAESMVSTGTLAA
jgi:hypothetical protein